MQLFEMRGARRACKWCPQVGPKGPFGPAGVFCLFAIAGFEKCLYLCITFSGARLYESKLYIALACKNFAQWIHKNAFKRKIRRIDVMDRNALTQTPLWECCPWEKKNLEEQKKRYGVISRGTSRSTFQPPSQRGACQDGWDVAADWG